MKYDVIIIGSGLGGLECGVLLSRRGKSVLVLERSNQPGGCMQSFSRRGFGFDTGLHYVGGLDKGQSLHEAFSQLGLLSLPWHRMDRLFDRVVLDDEEFCYSQGRDEFVQTLSEKFPSESRALKQYADYISNAPFDSIDVNAYDYLNKHFDDARLISVLAATSLKTEINRDTMPLFSLAHSVNGYIESSYRLGADGNALVSCLVSQIKANGGDVICSADVVRLVEQNGRIVSAETADGGHYEASHFISDIHPHTVCQLLSESKVIKKAYRTRMASLANTNGIFTVQLVLKEDARLKYFNYNKYIYPEGDVWSSHGLMVSARVPHDGSEYVRQIDLLSALPWCECSAWQGSTLGHRPIDYQMMKECWAQNCISIVEDYFLPGLSSKIDQIYTSTPLTYRDYLGAIDGSAFGIRKDSSRALQTFLSVRTAVPNLLLTGQNVFLPGVEGVTKTAFITCSELIGEDLLNNSFDKL